MVRAHRYGSPAFWWPLVTGLIALPTFALIDMAHHSDLTHLIAFLVALVSFVVSSLVYSNNYSIGRALAAFRIREETEDRTDAIVISIGILVCSVLVTIAYFYLIGYNMLVLTLRGLVLDYSSMRLSTYSGERYFAPGYVNQFKNTLYPIVTVAALIRLHRGESLLKWPATIAGIGFGIFALLGTGQRGYIIMTLCSTLYGLYLLNLGRGPLLSWPLASVLLLLTISLYGYMTLSYKQLAGGGLGAVLTELTERVFLIQQEGGLIGFRYVAERGPVLMEEWAKGWAGILPGREGSMIAHEIHGEIYGSAQGTVPLTAVGSAFQNGGITLVAVLSAFLGASYSYLYHRYLKGPRTILRALSYGTLFFYLATYVVGPPESLLDSGVLAVLILLLLRRLKWLPHREKSRGTRSALGTGMRTQSAPRSMG
jgi:hypothetical protein